jgi:ABC-type sugar transport system substrate-binding protein
MRVKLSHARNPDIPGGYWETPVDPARARWVEVDTFVAASMACREFIKRNGLGGGNWTGGDIEKNGTVIAYVSFNGRIWDDRKMGAKEIK